MDFKGRTVLITGASSGIGRAAAARFAGQGAGVILAARGRERLDTVEEELKKFHVPTLACTCDVSDRDHVKQMYDAVLERFGAIDILVNNAGFATYGYVKDLSIDDIESQMRTNYLGMVYCTKAFLPSMLERGSGHIVNVASVAASFGLPGIASYCASKFAMLGFSEGLKHELDGTGVGVTVVSPIMVRTGFFDNSSFEGMPRNDSLSLDPGTVAGAILRAAGSPRLEIIVPPLVRGAVWLKHTAPYLVNTIAGRSFKRQLDAACRHSSPDPSRDSSDFRPN